MNLFNFFSFICTSILGSLFTFLEINEEELISNFGLTCEDLYKFQEQIITIYSKFLYGINLSIEQLMNMNDPIKNGFILDLIQFSLSDEFKSVSLGVSMPISSLENLNKIQDLVTIISNALDNCI